MDYVKRKGHFSMTANHFHPHYEVYYLCEGERMYFVKDRSYRVKAGDLVFIGRQVLHKTSDTGIPDHERIVISLRHEWLERAYPGETALLTEPFTRECPVVSLPARQFPELKRIISGIMKEMREQEAGYAVRLRHAMVELLLMAARAPGRNDEGPAVTGEEDSPMHVRMIKVVQYLNDHYAEPLSLTGVAQQFDISSYYLSRIFKSATGFAFTEYMNLLRLKEAQRLLRESGLQITEIALRTGFDNFSHFGKAFKKMAGLPPRAYRSANRPLLTGGQES
ncbi:helix-turn-helix domain-containing protein [Paenibacillus nasutitermitis]|nr:AraC family transcriptional regulator [Paenibacillus nasutitermitis]